MDFLYAEELQRARDSGVLNQLHVEFSGDNGKPKRVRCVAELAGCRSSRRLTNVRYHVFYIVCPGRAAGPERARGAAPACVRRLHLRVRESSYGPRREEGHCLGSSPTPGVLGRRDHDAARSRAHCSAEAGRTANRHGALVAAAASSGGRSIDRPVVIQSAPRVRLRRTGGRGFASEVDLRPSHERGWSTM